MCAIAVTDIRVQMRVSVQQLFEVQRGQRWVWICTVKSGWN